VLVLRQVVSRARFSNIDQLVAIIKSVGRKLVDAQPKGALHLGLRGLSDRLFLRLEHTVGNTVAKVLHHVREEYVTASKGSLLAPPPAGPSAFSIAKFVLQGQPRKQNAHVAPKDVHGGERVPLRENDPSDPDSFAKTLKPVLMEAIQDVLDELETVYDNISKNAKDHIHSEYAPFVRIREWPSKGCISQRDHPHRRLVKDRRIIPESSCQGPQVHCDCCGSRPIVRGH
jgi:translation initiation factor eIF-2B subunit beta